MNDNQKKVTNDYLMKATEFIMEAEKETGVKSIDRLRAIYGVSLHLHMMDIEDGIHDRLNKIESALERLEVKP